MKLLSADQISESACSKHQCVQEYTWCYMKSDILKGIEFFFLHSLVEFLIGIQPKDLRASTFLDLTKTT
jgi:hypothetical protein